VPEGTYLQRLQGDELAELQSRLSDPERPFLVGFGPAEFSTSLALEHFPSIIWDVNGYYRDLGVNPKATRMELRKAYQALDGQGSNRLTMIMNVLLNPKRRLLYDLAPFGSLYVDAEVDEALRLQAVQAAAEARARGEELSDEEAQARYENMSESAEAMQDAMLREMQRGFQEQIGGWSFYLWRTKQRDMRQLPRLAQWRSLLAKWLNEYHDGPPYTLGVGFFAGDQEVAIAVVGYRVVIFLNEKSEPTDVVACMAVVELLRHQQTKQPQLNQVTGV
jgi:hypothetical protein